MGKIYKNGILFAGSTDSAKSVAFDNTDTGLEADNVQEAIEEVKSGIDLDIENINSNLNVTDVKSLFSVSSDVTNFSAFKYGNLIIANFKMPKGTVITKNFKTIASYNQDDAIIKFSLLTLNSRADLGAIAHRFTTGGSLQVFNNDNTTGGEFMLTGVILVG